MKAFICSLFGWAWILAWLAPTGALAADDYIDTKAIHIQELLPAPSAVGSPETLREIAFLMQLQESRTSEEVDRARSQENFSPFVFTNVVGPWFTKKNLPETSVLLDEVVRETRVVYMDVKNFWHRPRPPLQDMRLRPCLPLPKGNSYPSGQASRAVVVARVLAELAPDLRAPLEERAKQIGNDRLIAVVHFPSDIEAGQKLGEYLFEQFDKSPAFQEQLAKAKAEFERVRAAKGRKGA